MGGPSKKEIQSAETLTAYIDGEITDKLLLELFELELSENFRLQSRLQNMVAIKSQISSIFGTNQMQATEFVKKKIRNIVENAQIPGTLLDQDDDKLQATDAELLINSLIDGELAESELRMVEKLVIENDAYRELYEQLVTSKINISDNLFQQNAEPSAKVKMDIKSLVSGTLSRSESDGIAAYSQVPEQSIMPEYSKLGKTPSRTNRFSSSFNYYAQRLVPLAAVFAVGLFISPPIFSSGTKPVPGPDLTLRGTNAKTNLGEGSGFISIINDSTGLLTSLKSVSAISVSAQEAFHFELTAPTSGEMFVYLATSKHKTVTQLDKGADPKRVGFVEAGQSVRYPATQNITIEPTDQLLRIDIEIRGDNKIFKFTEFVENTAQE